MADTKPKESVLGTRGAGPGSTPGGGGLAAPVALPPSVSGAALATTAAATATRAAFAATTWSSGRTVDALWTINENRNAWIGVAGVGWVKLANNSDTAIVALTALGASAKLTQASVSYRQEGDGMIHEMYVF